MRALVFWWCWFRIWSCNTGQCRQFTNILLAFIKFIPSKIYWKQKRKQWKEMESRRHGKIYHIWRAEKIGSVLKIQRGWGKNFVMGRGFHSESACPKSPVSQNQNQKTENRQNRQNLVGRVEIHKCSLLFALNFKPALINFKLF